MSPTLVDVKISQADAAAIAALLTPGPWASRTDPTWCGYAREAMATLVYIGDDPLLQGADLTCFTRPRVAQYEWRCGMHATTTGTGGSRFLVDTLPYAQRDTWVGSINVSTKKPVTRVAKEIQTRLLEHYLPAYRHAMEVLQQEKDQHTADVALAEELAGILGGKAEKHPWQDPRALQIFFGKLWPLTVSGGQVNLERQLHMTPDEARQLCALVATWKRD